MKTAIILFVMIHVLSGNLSPVSFFEDGRITHLKQPEELFAKIVTEKKTNNINIKGIFFNLTDSSFYLYYEMITAKNGNSGSSKSKQSGKFHSTPNSETTLAEVGLDVDESANYEIILRVFDKGNLISADSLSLILNH